MIKSHSGLILSILLLSACSSLQRSPSSSQIEERFELPSGAEFPQRSFPLKKWRKWEITQMNDSEISQVFRVLASSNLPFQYPRDCCHDRAHKMAYWLDQRRIISLKIFVFGDLKLEPKTGTEVKWEFHVAPALMNQKSDIIILDPSVSNEPLELSQWLLKFSKPHQNIRVEPATRFYYSPADLEFDRFEWNESEMKELVDLSLMGCKAVENHHKKEAAQIH